MSDILYCLINRYMTSVGMILHFDLGGGSNTTTVDNTALAAASEKAAVLGKELGDAQLAESKRQYEINRGIAEPVVAEQLGLMKQSKAQGDDYYNYNVNTFRPLEKRMVSDAEAEGSDARLDEASGQAVADMRRGQTSAANMMARQGLRYGFSPSKLAAVAASQGGANASAVAGAATGARNTQRNLGWARRMDAAGLGRNLPGASTGAYGVSTGAGNSAVTNGMAPGGALLNGMNQGAAMQQQGAAQNIQGQSAIYNGGVTLANANRDNSGGGLGAMLGAGAQLGSAYLMRGSDRRMKKDIVLVGRDEKTGLNLYDFHYIDNDDTRFRGVMADEVRHVMPEAVERYSDGFDRVNYGMLGIQMEEV